MVPVKEDAPLLVTAKNPVSGLVQKVPFELQKAPESLVGIAGTKVGGVETGTGDVQCRHINKRW